MTIKNTDQNNVSKTEYAPSGLDLYFSRISKIPLLDQEQETELTKKVKQGDRQAFNQLVTANLRLVIVIAREYTNKGLSIEDLISYGNEGLMVAVKRFNLKKGARLATYAGYWIRNHIRRALSDDSRTIRLPVHLIDKYQAIHSITQTMIKETGIVPTDDEIDKRLKMRVGEIQRLKNLAPSMISLNSDIRDEDGSTFADIIPDEHALTSAEKTINADLCRFMNEVVQTLLEREAKIITKRYGLDGNKPLTLEQVAAEFNITRERIRQIQDDALVKMRYIILRHDSDLVKNGMELT